MTMSVSIAFDVTVEHVTLMVLPDMVLADVTELSVSFNTTS